MWVSANKGEAKILKKKYYNGQDIDFLFLRCWWCFVFHHYYKVGERNIKLLKLIYNLHAYFFNDFKTRYFCICVCINMLFSQFLSECL